MIDIHNLTTGYTSGKKQIVISHDIEATIPTASLTSLLGPNGAGKSTLLRTLARFLPALGGEVIIEGKPLSSYTSGELSRQVSVVLTERPSVIAMTVEEMTAIGRSPYTGFRGKLTKDDRDIIERSMKMAGVADMRNRAVDTLSDGERQKVMIAKALAQATPIILLDEPSAFLDYPSKVELMLMLRRLAHSENKTILLSTHDINIALQLSDRIMLVDKNIGSAIGTSSELTSDGTLNSYFTSPAIRLDPDSIQFEINNFDI